MRQGFCQDYCTKVTTAEVVILWEWATPVRPVSSTDAAQTPDFGL